MAIIKIVSPPIHPGGKRGTYAHLKHAIDYILKAEKTGNGLYTGSQNCSCTSALEEMMETKRQYGKEPDANSEGYMHDRLGYHFVISWSPEEKVTPEVALEITGQFCEEYLQGYETVYSAHVDQEHMHTHIVFNSVNYKTGKKYHCPKGEWNKHMQILVDRLCKENGLHSLEDDTGIPVDQYEKRLHTKQSADIRRDIDQLVKECGSFEEFESRLTGMGYTIGYGDSQRYGTYMKLKTKEMKRFRRTYALGADYTVEMIKFRIAAYHKPLEGKGFFPPDGDNYIIGKRIYHGRICYGTSNTYLRKQYARMYRLGILPRHAARLDYRERMRRIKEIRNLEFQLDMIAENDYCKFEDLDCGIENLEKAVDGLKEEKRRLNQEKKPYEDMLRLYEHMEELEGGWILFQEGDRTFEGQAKEFEKTVKEAEKIPHTRQELEQCLNEYVQKEHALKRELWKERKKLKNLQELRAQYHQIMREYEPASDEMLEEMEQYGAEPDGKRAEGRRTRKER